MKILFINFLLIISSFCSQLKVTMEKGSCVVGSTDIELFKVDTGFGIINVPMKQIVAVKKGKDNQVIFLKNGSIIFGKLLLKEFKLDTAVGRLSVSIDKISDMVVLENKDLVANFNGSNKVNGLELKILKTELTKKEKDYSLSLKLQVINHTKRELQIPYPELANGMSHSRLTDSYELFHLKFENLDMSQNIPEQHEELQRMISNERVTIKSGDSIFVNLTIKIQKEFESAPVEELAKAQTKNFDLSAETCLDKGKYKVLISIKNFIQKNVWIVDEEGKMKEWTGLIQVYSAPIEVKWEEN